MLRDFNKSRENHLDVTLRISGTEEFNINILVNGKDISQNEGESLKEELSDKIIKELEILMKKLKKLNPNTTILKELITPTEDGENTINLGLLKDRLPIIDSTNTDGKVKIDLNGKPFIMIDLSEFIL